MEYKNSYIGRIETHQLINARFSNILDSAYIEWSYEIGDYLKNNPNVKIIDRFRKRNNSGFLGKYYKIKCEICGFDSTEYYLNGEYKEYWCVSQSELTRNDKNIQGCPCCSGRIVVPGINDINTTHKWIVNYLKNKEDAIKYSHGSHLKLDVNCIFCNENITKKYSPDEIIHLNGVPCVCNDGVSFPNKFTYYLFKELKDQYDYYEREYSPTWSKLYRYDNYFELNNNKYILEMDGNIGHGMYKYKSREKDESGKIRDEIKDKLAIEHNINIIRIHFDSSDPKYLKDKLIENLKLLFEFKYVNWDNIEYLSHNNNFLKNIYTTYEKLKNNYKTMDEFFLDNHISKTVFYRSLKYGIEHNWCTYVYVKDKAIKDRQIVIEYYNKNKNSKISDIVNNTGVPRSSVMRYLKYGTEHGLCNYEKYIN